MSNFDSISFNSTTHSHKRRAKTPSFSSILLDAIYRSIDDAGGDSSIGVPPATTDFASSASATPMSRYVASNSYDYNYSSKSKQRRSKMRSDSTFETLDLRQAIMIESWMEKQEQQQDHGTNVLDDPKIRIVRQKSVPSGSTVPDTSSRSFSKIRTNLASRAADSCFAPPTKRETPSRIFTKTKSRAMKIYGDLKKAKPPQNLNQPISPGAKIAAFLNSLFRNSSDRKPNTASPAAAPISASTTSTCSSTTSFSRSCLSKTPSSRGKSSSGTTTRSVRFYPISVIVDEDSRPCGHKSLHKEEETPKPKSDHHRNPSTWRREKEIDALMKMVKRNCSDREVAGSLSFNNNGDDDSDEEMNDFDGESCASSDLFELENLSSIGVSRYAEELPVYGTTNLHMLKG